MIHINTLVDPVTQKVLHLSSLTGIHEELFRKKLAFAVRNSRLSVATAVENEFNRILTDPRIERIATLQAQIEEREKGLEALSNRIAELEQGRCFDCIQPALECIQRTGAWFLRRIPCCRNGSR